MNKKSNKIVAAILAAVFSIQMMVISDGALFTPNNISAFGDFIEEQVNKKSLKNEFNEAVSKLGNIDYFDKNNLGISKTIYSAEEIGISNTLYLKGYIGLVHGGDNTKIKILVFNGWDLVEETYAYADGSFEVYAYGLTGETNIKIECDGYLPRFYKGMGYGEYQLGYSDEPEMLYPGDTLYNEWESNQWSDEVINANDADFVYGFIGLHKGSENYLAEYDFDENGVIDDDDFSIYEAYLGVTNDHEDYVPFLDVDENGIIDELDYDSVYNFCYGTYAGDADYRDYMDINKNGVIDSDDHAWFVNYCQIYDGYNSENSYMKNITLLGDCYIPGSFNLHDANLDLNGCVLSVEDCMSFTTDNPSLWSDGEGGEGATLDLYGGKLIIANNFVFRTASPDGWGGPTAQALEMNCGTLDIGGHFDFGQAHCYDYIVMENPEDELWISGNWNYVTSMDMEGLWTAGTIYFCGSTWQVNELSGEKSIFSSDYHNIVFFYEYGQQVIRWDNPKDYWYETDRQFNFELYTDLENLGCGGMFFPYGFSEDLYLFRPALPFDFEDGFDMYRNGWEMGDGIDLATGNYTKSFVDMSVNSPGLNIDFIRTFNSTSEEIGAFGKGWDFNIDVSKIVTPSPGYYQVVLPDGSNSTFKNENGIYKCQNNRNKMRTTNGEYIITIANQTEYYYKNNSKSELYLYKIVDVNANKMEISDVINNERTITDSLNGTYTIQYENDRVKSITDNQSARTVTYDYNNSNLVSVTDANGAVETYGYDSNSRLNQITNPCGQVTEQIFYHNDGKVDYLFNANGLKQVYQYDRLRKNTEIHEYDGDELVKRTACDYDEKHAINTNIVYADGQRYEIEKVIYDTDSSGKNRYSDTKEHIDELGNKTVYDRDENGNITKTLYPDGTVTRARFNSQNSPLIQVDAMNNVNLFVYDETGVNVLKEAQSLTKLTDADIDALLANEDVTNYLKTNFANFAVTTYDYIDYNVSNVRILGLIRTITDPEGNVTEYEYNTNGTLAKEFKYKGSKPAYSTNYEYNDIWLPSRTTSAEGHVQEFDYDKNGNQIRVKDFGKRKDEVLPAPAITRTVYDSAGRKIKEVAPEFYNNSLEQTNGYGYDVNNTDTANYATYSYYPSGLVLTMTAPEGNITSFVYDVYGNQVKETKADGTQNIIEYDKMGRALRSYFKESETSGNRVLLSESVYSVVNETVNVYDKNGNPQPVSFNGLLTTQISHISSSKTLVTEVFTDCNTKSIYEKANGKLKNTSEYYANGQLRSTKDAKGNVIIYKYDYMNLLTETLTPFNEKSDKSINYNILKQEYYKDGTLKATESTIQEQSADSPEYSRSEFEYNPLGLLTKVRIINPNGADCYSQYYYDNDGVKVRMYTGMTSALTITGLDEVSGSGDYLTTKYFYDQKGNLESTEDSAGYKQGPMTYDLNGNLLTSKDAEGYTTSYEYDKINRVTSMSVNTGDASKNVTKTYVYDVMGRLETAVNNNDTTQYQYDLLGRLVREDTGNGFVKGYFYYGTSENKERMFTGVNHLLIYNNTYYEYDDEMRLDTVSDTDGTASYTYDDNGNKATVVYGNGDKTEYEYNLANRVVGITNKNDDTVLSTLNYSYYLDGSEACKIRNEYGTIGFKETTNYTYDGLRRLLNESVQVEQNSTIISDESMTYAYDGYNNRVTMTVTGEDDYVTSYNYNDVNGNYTALLQSETKLIGGLTQEILYTYDANGNQLTKADPDTGLSTFEYDGLNQLIEADCNGKTAQYTYDHNGLRISKTVDGVLTKHIWDGNQIITDVDASVPYGATTYLRGTGLISVQEKYGAQVLTLKYYLQNAHGDVVSLTDSNGIKVKIYRYDAFGVEQDKDDNDSNPFRYCGEYYDSETDTIYLRARYYSPSIGRFISRDSYTGDDNDPLSLNLYTYGANNPVLYADESGHFFNLAAAAVGALVGAAVNVAITAAADYIQNGKITKSASEYAAAAASGAIGGLAAGFTMGGSLAVQVAGQAAIGAATSAAGSVAEQAIVKKEIDWGRVGKDALIGGVSGAVSAGAGALVKKAKAAKPLGPSGGNKGCFTAGTLVLTASGYMAIEDIQVGDFVWSENPETGEKELKEVINTFVHVKDTLVYVTINDEVIETTREHPFWIEGQGWTAAELLKVGDVVRLESGENSAIDNVEVSPLDEYIKVYNFEVEDFHTYYVSDDDVLVHNSCKFELPETVKSPKGVKGNFSEPGYSYRIDTNKVAPGEGGFHIHVFRKKQGEIAKLTGRGGYVATHKGKTLLKPSQMNKTVRNELNKLVNYVKKNLD